MRDVNEIRREFLRGALRPGRIFGDTIRETDDLFDGFDPKTVYQMVPVSGTRPMTLIAEEDDCTMVVDPPGIAKMQNFVYSAPVREVPDKYRAHVTRRNRITFDILGERRGNTTIFLLDRKDDVFGTLLVSVKRRSTKPWRFVFCPTASETALSAQPRCHVY